MDGATSGRIHEEAFGNGLVTTREYSPGKQRVRRIVTKKGPQAGLSVQGTPSPLLQDLTYGYDNVDFGYDGDQRRILKSVSGGDVTVYLGDLYERVTHHGGAAEHKYYVHAAGRVVAIVSRSPDTQTTLYAHTDHLGSIDVLTDDAGHVAERRSYDPFGGRRNPKWGDATPPGAPLASLGFTGHESDDPKLGRFLTPDPVVPAPLAGQSWNPYSYVVNNPLSLVDPSGFDYTVSADGSEIAFIYG